MTQEKVLSISSAHDSWSVEPAQRDYSWVVMERRVTVGRVLVVRSGAFCQTIAALREDVEEVVRQQPARLSKVDVGILQERLALDVDEERTCALAHLNRIVPSLGLR